MFMFNLLRHQTTRAVFVRGLLRQFTHSSSSVIIKDFGTITKHVLFSKKEKPKPLFSTRFFHSSPVDYSSCDFGGPCSCSECMQDQRKSICEICRVHPTVRQDYKDSHDREGIRSISFTSYCEQCWQKHETALGEMAERRRQTLALHEARVASMLDNVQQIRLTEQVPIVYAVDRFMREVKPTHDYTPRGQITAKMMNEMRKIHSTEKVSQRSALKAIEQCTSKFKEIRHMQSLNRFRGRFQRRIIDGLSEELQIVKIRNKYMCNRQRVDAMDFKLWTEIV